tara:strand:- start:3750 stop:4199 length:450 start_codon:yes stop_codon:yes gene_type:complete
MKKLLFTLSIFAIGTWAMAQTTEVANPNAPKIKFQETVLDYGTIDKGSNGVRTFEFTNEGNEPLIVTKTKGSCGCTVPTKPTEPIAPGDKGVIKVKYDTNRVGPFTKTVTVSSNADTPTVVLKIKGVVKNVEPVKTSPENTSGASLIQN